ncbi:MAG: exodeoxyribonuclease VII small subunit [Eubacteriaceae bacterium]|nr:exodeoxyribonuclease VII small subunit [Eubacteriaceae bacterium]MCR4722632.1 exodeoxyribonuclease VII small subunit [Eubacteriales bacterium]
MAETKSFEEKMKRLEEIGELMQDSSIALKESVSLYEEGIGLISELKKELAEAEEKVKILTEQAKEPVLNDYN